MKTFFHLFLIGLATIGCAAATFAAPIRRMMPVTVEGTIVEAGWSPTAVKAGRPGFSGSLGKDRTFPAHFDVALSGYQGLDAATARRICGLIGHPSKASEDADRPPPTVWLRISEEDSQALKKGMRIRVSGYHVTGDEGGTWTHHDKVIVLPAPSEK